MGEIRWYKRDPHAALQGMSVLSLEERGAYNTILDLLYARDGHLPDDEREIARLMHCDIRTWRRLRRKLMDRGKLYIHAGCIHNQRADDEINFALRRIAKTRIAGLKGAETRRIHQRTRDELRGGSSGDVSGKLVHISSKIKGIR